MGSFGERLQREREMRGITLEEIAEATKIGTRSLRALEEEDFDRLPGGIFNKGFVRAYARYLGLDEEQAVADYQAALNEAMAAGKLTRQESPASMPTPELIVEEREPLRLPLVPIVAVVLIAVALFAGWKYMNHLPKLRQVRAAGTAAAKPEVSRSEASPVRPAPQPTTSGQAQPATESPRARPNPAPSRLGFVVRLKAKETSWVEVTADGKKVMSGELAADSEKSVHAQQSVVVKIGNAGGLELYHNDKLVPPLGESGKVRTLEFTTAGLRR